MLKNQQRLKPSAQPPWVLSKTWIYSQFAQVYPCPHRPVVLHGDTIKQLSRRSLSQLPMLGGKCAISVVFRLRTSQDQKPGQRLGENTETQELNWPFHWCHYDSDNDSDARTKSSHQTLMLLTLYCVLVKHLQRLFSDRFTLIPAWSCNGKAPETVEQYLRFEALNI